MALDSASGLPLSLRRPGMQGQVSGSDGQAKGSHRLPAAALRSHPSAKTSTSRGCGLPHSTANNQNFQDHMDGNLSQPCLSLPLPASYVETNIAARATSAARIRLNRIFCGTIAPSEAALYLVSRPAWGLKIRGPDSCHAAGNHDEGKRADHDLNVCLPCKVTPSKCQPALHPSYRSEVTRGWPASPSRNTPLSGRSEAIGDPGQHQGQVPATGPRKSWQTYGSALRKCPKKTEVARGNGAEVQQNVTSDSVPEPEVGCLDMWELTEVNGPTTGEIFSYRGPLEGPPIHRNNHVLVGRTPLAWAVFPTSSLWGSTRSLSLWVSGGPQCGREQDGDEEGSLNITCRKLHIICNIYNFKT